jgi:hypothetical protein
MAGHIPDSLSVDWCTEDKYIACVHETFEGPPETDPCSNPHSRVRAKHEFMLQNGRDGLLESWGKRSAFMNPPFGKGWWKSKPHQSQCNGLLVDGGFGPPYCACGAGRQREYIWPADRAAKAGEFLTQAQAVTGMPPSAPKTVKLAEALFKAWAKDYTLVDIGDWIERAADFGDYMSDGVVGLIPGYPGTKAWQDHVWPRAKRVFFPRGRLHFRLVYTHPDGTVEEKTGPAPMDCAFPLWTCNLYVVHAFEQAFGKFGRVVTP